jgi:prepilin-type N-terminal cleavage/methylation domain-containing protein
VVFLVDTEYSEVMRPAPSIRASRTAQNPGCAFTLKQRERKAFTLLELLIVVAIISILLVLVVPAFTTIKSADDVTKAAYDISGTLEQARTFAIGNDTYVFVGFFEEGPGQVLLSVVASKNGTRVYSDTVNDPPPLNAAFLTQISKLIKLGNIHLDRLTDSAITRADVPPDQYHVGHADFAKRLQYDGSMISNNTTFSYPLTGTAQYTFTKIIQFNPQGDATKIVDTPARSIEIGLRPAHGTAIDNNSRNLVAVQVEGITGQSKMYRP